MRYSIIKHTLNPGRHQQGVTLIEVLVTVLILGIGLLGLASLQSVGLSYNTGALLRTQATILAQDIEEKIRSNIEEKTNSGGVYFTIPAPPGITSAAIATAPTNCATVSCDTADLAAYDLADWCSQFSDCAAVAPTPVLPNSSASITRNAATGVFTVTINWTEKADTKNPDFVKTHTVSFL